MKIEIEVSDRVWLALEDKVMYGTNGAATALDVIHDYVERATGRDTIIGICCTSIIDAEVLKEWEEEKNGN